jgi:hypothetical protein
VTTEAKERPNPDLREKTKGQADELMGYKAKSLGAAENQAQQTVALIAETEN